MSQKPLVLHFSEIRIEDTSLVGGKNAALGEMYSALTPLGINIPNGFAITAASYDYFIKENNLKEEIDEILKDLNTKSVADLQEKGEKIRSLILKGTLPPVLKKQIEKAYEHLTKNSNSDVAVRSSATAEDLPGASFAGQQETFLNVRGKENLLEAVRKCFASLFTNRAISYRHDKRFDNFKIALSVGVQLMTRSDLASSGVAFTLDPDTGFDKVIVVNGTFGLGELIVQGQVTPDEWVIFKEGLAKNLPSIIEKRLGFKNKKIIYSGNGGTKLIDTQSNESGSYCLSDKEVLRLAGWCQKIEDHFSKKYGKKQAMDIEWAKDGKTNELFIIQARPETVHSGKKVSTLDEYVLSKKGKILLSGISVGTKIASGAIRVAKSIDDIKDFRKNEILVAQTTDPDWEPIMKIAGAIITDKGGRTSHAAIVARELGIPCIVGAQDATEKLKTGQKITIDCSTGSQGFIYEGEIPFEIKSHNLRNIPKTKTKVMVNIGSPDEAFENYYLPVSGVGLAREEFIIASEIKIHPKALINFEALKDKKLKAEIEELTKEYKDKRKFYVDRLSSGVSKIAASFWPYQVIVRFSDFKSNEYKSLLGGSLYEPQEENPMIGWRGASRYYDPKFSDAFRLEVRAIKKAREELGLSNIAPMIPFTRTVEELKKAISIIEEEGLKRDLSHIKTCNKDVEDCSHLRIYMMCEIPSNVVLADQFLPLIDGYSIGSNDLTQLTLGVDRDSNIISKIADENNEAVRILIRDVIKKCKEMKKYIGLCGQGPSDSLEFAQFLIECGIDSVSLNPDSVIKTVLHIAKIEGKNK